MEVVELDAANEAFYRGGILTLLNDVFRGQFIFDEEYWKWKYIDNPSKLLCGYIALVDSEVVGVRMVYIMEYGLDVRYKIFQPADSAVSQAYQGKGLFRALNNAFIDGLGKKSFPRLVLNFPNSNSIGTYRRLGWNKENNYGWIWTLLWGGGAHSGNCVLLAEAHLALFDIEFKYAKWRFLSHPRNIYYIYLLGNKFAVFVTEKSGLFRTARCVYSNFSVFDVHIFRDFRRALRDLDVRWLVTINNGDGLSNLVLRHPPSIERRKRLNCVINENISTAALDRNVQLYMCDFF